MGVVAVADGGQDMGGVGTLLAGLPHLLQEELACSNNHTYALKYALLTALRCFTLFYFIFSFSIDVFLTLYLRLNERNLCSIVMDLCMFIFVIIQHSLVFVLFFFSFFFISSFLTQCPSLVTQALEEPGRHASLGCVCCSP